MDKSSSIIKMNGLSEAAVNEKSQSGAMNTTPAYSREREGMIRLSLSKAIEADEDGVLFNATTCSFCNHCCPSATPSNPVSKMTLASHTIVKSNA